MNIKVKAHNYFDLLWQERLMSRRQAYFKLKIWMNFKYLKQAHIKLLSTEECEKLIRILKDKYPDLYRNRDYLEDDLFY